MRVRAIDNNGDWTFGSGLSNYKLKADAIHQSVVTRLRSFTNDWLLDINAGIDWIELLGRKGTQGRIKRDIQRIVIGTDGVASIDNVEVLTNRTDRGAEISITVTDIYSNTFTDRLEVIA